VLQAVKDYLKITWDDEDNSLQGIIERGMIYLNRLMGVELDYEVDDEPKRLLLEYCRYVYNNAGEYFEENFRQEILRLQLMTGVSELEAVSDEA
jgi:hypothetical protein